MRVGCGKGGATHLCWFPSDDLVNKIKHISPPEENGAGLALEEIKWSVHFSFCFAHKYLLTLLPPPIFFSPSSCWFTMLINTLFMPWAFSPTLSNDRSAIFMPISLHSHGQLSKWQPPQCFFTLSLCWLVAPEYRKQPPEERKMPICCFVLRVFTWQSILKMFEPIEWSTEFFLWLEIKKIGWCSCS